MTINEAFKFIDYAKTFGSRLGLVCIKELLRRLGQPQNKRPVIHIAGTNGKGSTFAFLEAGLREGGYKVGRYISPALFTYLERFSINGVSMDEENFAEIAGWVEQACKDMVKEGFLHPTVFEVETAISFCYFAKEEVDVVLLETGMGGSEDATNVVEMPLATVFSSVSMDHMEFLGDTIADIAREKAGIMRKGVLAVIAPQWKEGAKQALLQYAICKSDSPYILVDSVCDDAEYSLDGTTFVFGGHKYEISMLGAFQPDNAATAISTWQAVKEHFPMEIEVFSKGLKEAKWRGRFEVLQREPYVIRDGAHNADAVKWLKKTLLMYFPKKRFKLIMGVFRDKDYKEMVSEILPVAEEVVTIAPPDSGRALLAEELREEIIRQNDTIPVVCASSMEEAWSRAVECSDKESVIVIFGSLSLAGEVERILK